MKNAFEVLSRFLERFGHDVQGRGLDPLPPEIRRQLRDFAQGKLDQNDRANLAAFLKEHPRCVERLAAEVISLRPEPEGGDQPQR